MNKNGFTFIELVIVIVLLSIIALGSVSFIGFSVQGYVDTALRSNLSSGAAIFSERLSRMLRSAVPGSIRVTADQRCLEYIPMLSATRYTQAPVYGMPVSTTQVLAVPVDNALAESGYLIVFPVTSDVGNLYNNTRNPGMVSTQIASVNGSVSGADIYEFAGGTSFQFEQGSPQQRLYISDQPRAICQQGTQAFLYQNYGFVGGISNLVSALPSALPNRRILIDSLAPNSLVFSVANASLRRNALVGVEVALESETETFSIAQEFQIRNVP